VTETPPSASFDLVDPAWGELDASGVVDRLAAEGRTSELLALWHTRDANIAVLVAPVLVAVGDPNVAALVAHEALHPLRGEPATTACFQALRARPPTLPDLTAGPILEALRTGELPVSPLPQGFQGLLELLALAQGGEDAATICRMVAGGETADSEVDEVRVACFRRSLRDPDLAARVVELVYQRFASDPGSRWADAVRLVETFEEAGHGVIAATLVNAIINASPTTVPVEGEHFPSGATASIYALGLETVRALFDGDSMPATPGTIALVELVDRIADKRRRKGLLTALARCQPALLEQALPRLMSSWDDDEWRWHLSAFAGSAAPPLAGAGAILSSAPAVRDISSLALRLALEQPEDVQGELLQYGSSRLRDVLNLDDELQMCERFWWPSHIEEVATERLNAWLDTAVDAEMRIDIVIRAFERDLINAPDVPSFLPAGSFLEAVRLLGAGELRMALVGSLLAASHDEAEEAVTELQNGEFAIDVAEAAAVHSPVAAFASADKAWPNLSEGDKDRLMDALEESATVAQVEDALAAILQHTHASNTRRRARAASKIAQLLPPGADLPDGVLDLLASARPELRDAGAAVLGAVRPRDVDVVRRLSQAAVQAEGEDEAAVTALRAIQDDFLDRLAAEPDTIERIDLLDLLGAVGTPGVVDPLLDHLGEEAVDDDVSVRRAAAKSLGAVSAIVEFTPQQQQRLVLLTDGRTREVDDEARDFLNDAVARVTLGENAALQILFDLIGYRPKTDPELLFGAHLNKLVRHLRLYSVDLERGSASLGLQIVRLDQIAEQLLRSAYLIAGDSDSIKGDIRTTATQPDYGGLIQACAGSSDLRRTQAALGVLHDLRSHHSEVPHPGEEPTEENMTSARDCFGRAAAALVGVLDNAHQATASDGG
jgi:hypothetical protein